MITLDTNIILLCSMFNISYRKLSNEYSGMSVEEIMDTEAAQGNTAAANFDRSILGDPVKLMELFKLNDVGNKYAILSNMNEHDLENLLPLLSQTDLIQGLQFFTKDKLLALVEKLPKEDLVKYAFNMFSQEQVMQMMPDDQLNKVLTSEQLDKNMVQKYLSTLKPEVLAQMYEAATGELINNGNVGLDGHQIGMNLQDLVSKVSMLPDDKFQDAILSIPTQAKKDFTLKLAQENPNIYLLFDAEAYTNIINMKKDKQDMIKASNVIDSKQLVKMLKDLPRDLTAVVLTQIDPKKFADVLIANFKDILAQVIAG